MKSSSEARKLNSYDVLKSVAILSMVIDHAGMFFLPEYEWIRAFGRAAMPLFLFLVGYSNKYVFSPDLLILGLLLTLYKYVLGFSGLEANILFTIFMVRLTFGVLDRSGLLYKYPAEFMIFCIVISIPTVLFFEYGTLAFMFAYCGYAVRNIGIDKPKTSIIIAVTILFDYLLQAYGSDSTSLTYFIIFSLVSVFLALVFTRFKLADIRINSGAINVLIMFLSRNALAIYVIHFVLFSAISRYLVAN